MGLGGGMDSMGGMGFGRMEDEMMEMGMGMEYTEVMPDELFRHGLQRAIHSLKNAKSDKESETLRGYVRAAFSDRYDKMIADRTRDIARLKENVAKLEGDLKRREAAKERVVHLQLQSVQLAAEGLLDLGELQGIPVGGRGRGPGYGGGGDFDEMDDDYGSGR